jgi:hypothetical protein
LRTGFDGIVFSISILFQIPIESSYYRETERGVLAVPIAFEIGLVPGEMAR